MLRPLSVRATAKIPMPLSVKCYIEFYGKISLAHAWVGQENIETMILILDWHFEESY